MRPVLEYGSSVWDPQSILLQDELEKVQKRAARFVTGNYTYETGSMTGILEQLKGIPEKEEDRLIMLYKALKGAASIPTPHHSHPASSHPEIRKLDKTETLDLKWTHMSAIFAHRPIGPLVSLDVTWRHVQMMLKSPHTRDLCVQSWSMVVQFGTPKAYFFKMNLRRCRKGQLDS